ncbi:synaptic plasticity regulator PANTS-like [Liolophura sinensis]|uniref:synaptic plasticity regulator PANTS-like n=1 Tax=Liolophura sinensis TaxID=3198878 RepID=UPI00315920C2
MSAPSESVTGEDKSEYIWLIRPCEMYYEEYADCSSLRGKFYHHYHYGHQVDCSKWKEDHKNCIRYRENPSPEIAMKIVENELERQQKRLENARGNDVWTYRKSPPKEWTRPLPEWTESRSDSLFAKVEAAKDQSITLSSPQSACVIL